MAARYRVHTPDGDYDVETAAEALKALDSYIRKQRGASAKGSYVFAETSRGYDDRTPAEVLARVVVAFRQGT